MPRYVLQRKSDDAIIDGISWNKKSHAEAWIQECIKKYGGLDWRVGGLFKCKNTEAYEVVWNKTHKSVKWYCIEPAPIEEYNPQDYEVIL